MNAISKELNKKELNKKDLNKIVQFDDVESLSQQAIGIAKHLGLLLKLKEEELKNFLKLRLFFLAAEAKPYAEYINLLSEMKAFRKDFMQSPVRIPPKLDIKLEGNKLEVCIDGQS